MIKLAMIQMLVEGGAKARNLARAEERIADAANCGSQIALLPEALDLGWTHPSSLTQAEPIPGGEPFARLADAARRHGIYVCAGLTERATNDRGADSKSSASTNYNSAALIGPDGRLLLRHRKLNELDIGRPYYGQGRKLEAVSTPLGTLGVMICADAFAPGQMVSRTLALMGAKLILSPCAWAVPADHDNAREPYGQIWRESYQPVAREFSLWIAGTSNVGLMTAGPWSGRRCVGCSLAVNANGEIVADGAYGESADVILMVDVAI